MPTAVQEAHAAHTTTGPGTVRVGDMTLGEGPPAVIGGAPGGADATSRPMGRWLSLRGHHGARDARRALTEERARWRGPLLVEPFSAADLPAIGDLADGVIVGAAWMQDFRLVRAAARLGLPMVVQRGPGATAQEWLAIVDYCAAEGNDRVVLCECGDRTRGAEHALNLGLMRAVRARSGRPVLVHLGTDAGLAGAAVAAGADGVLLAPEAGEETVAAAVEATALAAAVTVRRRGGPRRGPWRTRAHRSTGWTPRWPSCWSAGPSSRGWCSGSSRSAVSRGGTWSVNAAWSRRWPAALRVWARRGWRAS